jgi:hypothetical protein
MLLPRLIIPVILLLLPQCGFSKPSTDRGGISGDARSDRRGPPDWASNPDKKNVVPMPESSSLAMLAIMLGGVALAAWVNKRKVV